MFTKLVRGVVLACMVTALAVTGSAVAANKKQNGNSNLYKGKTHQKYVIKFKNHGGKINLVHFKIRLKCHDGSLLIDTESGFLPTPTQGNGRFHDKQQGSTDTVIMKGRANRKAITGKVRVRDRLHKKGPKCSSPWVKFRATR